MGRGAKWCGPVDGALAPEAAPAGAARSRASIVVALALALGSWLGGCAGQQAAEPASPMAIQPELDDVPVQPRAVRIEIPMEREVERPGPTRIERPAVRPRASAALTRSLDALRVRSAGLMGESNDPTHRAEAGVLEAMSEVLIAASGAPRARRAGAAIRRIHLRLEQSGARSLEHADMLKAAMVAALGGLVVGEAAAEEGLPAGAIGSHSWTQARDAVQAIDVERATLEQVPVVHRALREVSSAVTLWAERAAAPVAAS